MANWRGWVGGGSDAQLLHKIVSRSKGRVFEAQEHPVGMSRKGYALAQSGGLRGRNAEDFGMFVAEAKPKDQGKWLGWFQKGTEYDRANARNRRRLEEINPEYAGARR